MASPRTNPATNMSNLRARSTPGADGALTPARSVIPARAALAIISTESRPESISKDRSSAMPIAAAAPTALSKALWRPRSSRTTIRPPAASKGSSAKAAACAACLAKGDLGLLHRIAQSEDVSPVESARRFRAGRQSFGKCFDQIRSTETARGENIAVASLRLLAEFFGQLNADKAGRPERAIGAIGDRRDLTRRVNEPFGEQKARRKVGFATRRSHESGDRLAVYLNAHRLLVDHVALVEFDDLVADHMALEASRRTR